MDEATEAALMRAGAQIETLSAALSAAIRRADAMREANDRLTFRLRTIPDCPECKGAGGFGHPGFDHNGECGCEMCERCGGTGKAISDARDVDALRTTATEEQAARKALGET